MEQETQTFYDKDGNITSPPQHPLDIWILMIICGLSPLWIGLSLWIGFKVSGIPMDSKTPSSYSAPFK